MKYLKLVTTILISSVILIYSCNDKPSSKVREIPASTEDSNALTSDDDTSSDTSTEVAVNAQGIYHYTCSNGCAGGAGSAVNCENCGSLLVHNKAYHGNSSPTLSNDAPFATNPVAPSGQNTAGVWHYTCPSGCAGGSGSAGACSNCGTALAHNQAYH